MEPKERRIAIVLRDLLAVSSYADRASLKAALVGRLKSLRLPYDETTVDHVLMIVVGRDVNVCKSLDVAIEGTRRLDELDGLHPNDPERDEISKRLSVEDQVELMRRYGLPWNPKS